MTSFLRVMQPVSLEVREEQRISYYPSMVLDYSEGREVVVSVPSQRGYEVHVPAGTPVSVQVALPDALRVFSATVLRREEQPSPCLYLSWPESVDRVQRRNYVRVDVMVRVEAEVREEGEGGRALSGATTNLSAGGARLALPEQLIPESQITLTLDLPGVGPRECTARVIRGGEIPSDRARFPYWTAIEFVDIAETVRKEITNFVFEVQRDQIRKGLD